MQGRRDGETRSGMIAWMLVVALAAAFARTTYACGRIADRALQAQAALEEAAAVIRSLKAERDELRAAFIARGVDGD